MTNRQIRLAARPVGEVKPEDWEHCSGPVEEPGPGRFAGRTRVISLDAALTRLAMHARVVICGAISQYNNATPVKGTSNYLSPLVRRARMEGIVVFDYARRYAQAISASIGAGRVKIKEHVVGGGADDFPERLQMLFRGENVGKLVLELA